MSIFVPVGSRIPEGLSPVSMKMPRGGPLRRPVFLAAFVGGGGDGFGVGNFPLSGSEADAFWNASAGKSSSVASAIVC